MTRRRGVRPGGARWLWPLLICVVCTQTALNLARPLISYRAIGLGADGVAVGLITAAYALLSLVVAVPLGRLSDRSPRNTWLLAVGTALLCVAPLLLAASGSLFLVALASGALGFGHLVFMIAGQGLVARMSAAHHLDRNFGWYTAAVSLGQMAGPLAAGALLGETSGTALPAATSEALLVASIISGCGIPLAVALPRLLGAVGALPPAESADRLTVNGLLRRPGVFPGLFVSLSLLAAVDILTAYLPLIAEDRGIAPSVVGLLLGLRAAASILSRLLLARLLTRWSRKGLIMASTLGSALALLVVPLPFAGPVLMAAALLIAGFLLGLGQPLTMTIVVQAVPDSARSTALALRLWANRFGQVAMPAGAAALTGVGGASGALTFSSVVLLVAVLTTHGAPRSP